MKEHPILFSAPMVRAILEGRKTQTRRMVKFKNTFLKGITGQLQEHHEMEACYPMPRGGFVFWSAKVGKSFSDRAYKDEEGGYACPYGQAGDRLWVRETFTNSEPIYYRATLPDYLKDSDYIWKPSIFMPREFSRITLEIISVRVERLHQMTINKMEREGVSEVEDDRHPLSPFIDLWNTINEKRGFGWNVNPWVWVIEFQRAGLTPREPDKCWSCGKPWSEHRTNRVGHEVCP